MNLVPLGFLDTSSFTALFVSKHRAKMETDRLELRSAKGDLPILKDWKSANSLLRHIKNVTAKSPLFNQKPCDFGQVAVDILKAGDARSWKVADDDYAISHARLAICLIPSPGAWFYCGGDGMVFPVGQVIYINRQAHHCEANFGPCAQAKLLIDVRRPEAD